MLAALRLGLACSSRRIARALGLQIRTRSRWGWWRRQAARSSEMARHVEGPVDADALDHTAGPKGQAKPGGQKSRGRCAPGRRQQRAPGRGHDDTDRPAMLAWGSRQGAVVRQATTDFTVQTV